MKSSACCLTYHTHTHTSGATTASSAPRGKHSRPHLKSQRAGGWAAFRCCVDVWTCGDLSREGAVRNGLTSSCRHGHRSQRFRVLDVRIGSCLIACFLRGTASRSFTTSPRRSATPQRAFPVASLRDCGLTTADALIPLLHVRRRTNDSVCDCQRK